MASIDSDKPFQVEGRFQLEDLSAREDCSRLLLALILRVGRSVFRVATFGAVLVVFLDDFVLVVGLVAVLLNVRLVWQRRL